MSCRNYCSGTIFSPAVTLTPHMRCAAGVGNPVRAPDTGRKFIAAPAHFVAPVQSSRRKRQSCRSAAALAATGA